MYQLIKSQSQLSETCESLVLRLHEFSDRQSP